ncbi:1-aminocyclopropane-1-carboxylate deaminase/D-cysteine desulfhydrase [Amycolatopsis australiensis]|uniref:1-aminocyclopropane-1-carboxylate deaminase/D-cysteine desulfhydrase n=1 Tax=Amycolatopsis australiensis TaxID=546364 RepID=UPI000A878789|nr:pyridoxal-phosphate dependent enzyme [Amycolatopsis australiensis]
MNPGEHDLASSVRLPSPLVELRDERLELYGVELLLKRDDLIHPEVPGNKWRKLRYNLEAARGERFARLLTFGGAFSNHIRATAAAGYYLDFETVGVIRGEAHLPLNDALAYATGRGMVLTYLDRATYRRKTEPDVLARLLQQFGPCYVLPEGGSNGLAVRGCAELVAEITVDFDVIACACGTGGTLCWDCGWPRRGAACPRLRCAQGRPVPGRRDAAAAARSVR